MTTIEHPERYSWWLNELESLGISTLEKNGLANDKEAGDLAEVVKLSLSSCLFPLLASADIGFCRKRSLFKPRYSTSLNSS